jgi:hypothetical protein
MFYIHQTSCISPQHTFGNVDLETVVESVDNRLYALEPAYTGIPLGTLRRMGKAVRIGVGAALPLVQQNPGLNGVVIGTANGGLEDCIKFLNQIIQYEEGTLTPTNFVQSTSNAIAAQVGMYSGNKGYNITHVHRGMAFENALLDVDMLLKENPKNRYILGGVEEISVYNYNIQILGGWYKKETIVNKDLYNFNTPGSIAGEGASMFIVDAERKNAMAAVVAFSMLHSDDIGEVNDMINDFLRQHKIDSIDLLLSGENGDSRFLNFYIACEKSLGGATPVARFKHISGEHQSASSMALWMGCYFFSTQSVPAHLLKGANSINGIETILIYNSYEGYQHSLILLNKINQD